ncbi:MAG TPA: hypothetical protein PLL26_05435 [Candidatus Dojkabacteria bacterium]|nr:hypothetical protein [Candidatus Dojkabacteria bacterium]
MKKIKLKFPESAKKEILFGEQKIEVDTFIGQESKAIILMAMNNSKENDSAIKFVENENGLIFSVLDRQTNIDINHLDIDAFISSGIWEKIKSAISNFDELFSDIEKIKKIESSETKLNRILDKIETLLNNVANLDFSDESIKNMSKVLGEQLGKLSDVFPQIKQGSNEP